MTKKTDMPSKDSLGHADTDQAAVCGCSGCSANEAFGLADALGEIADGDVVKIDSFQAALCAKALRTYAMTVRLLQEFAD